LSKGIRRLVPKTKNSGGRMKVFISAILFVMMAITLSCSHTAKQPMMKKYTKFKLTSDLSHLTPNQKKMIPLLIDAAKEMDEVFWMQAYGDKESLLKSIQDPDKRKFAEVNYGPWDRLDGLKPFVVGIGVKPKGARFYPADIKKEEIEKSKNKDLKSLYTVVKRVKGELKAVPYHVEYKKQHLAAAAKIEQAAKLAKDRGLRRYLRLRAKALRNDKYKRSDMAWMDMKRNAIDFVVGPIETYEDQLFGYKAAHEAYVLIKDVEWSKRLTRYAALLPGLQKGLPVPAKYKREKPGRKSDLNAYDVVFYAGDCNAGAKTIAINLPNDEDVQLKKGSRRLQLKNAMKAKFEKILVPISKELIAEDQRKHITFDAFFGNTMFHEVAHGLGIKKTVNGKGKVRTALKEHSSAIEEGKADILGLYLVSELVKNGEYKADMKDHYVTFMAGIFRSVRFGSSSSHGKANLIRFNFFKEKGAFSRDESTGHYRVNYDQMEAAMTELSQKILKIQGDGNYESAKSLVQTMGVMRPQLTKDLARVNRAGIPVDIIFEQGTTVLGL
jgi:hypothetical protein